MPPIRTLALALALSASPTIAAQESQPTAAELAERSLDQLRTAMQDHYSHYRRLGLDWAAEEAKHRDAILAAETPIEWAKAAGAFLSTAQDGHLWLSLNGQLAPTYRRPWHTNFSIDAVRATFPELEELAPQVHSARTDDGIAYLLIGTWDQRRGRSTTVAQDAIDEAREDDALVLDVRSNGGGSEPFAMAVAAWFVEGTKVYAQHVTRDPQAEGGFSEPFRRFLPGNRGSRRFAGPVAVLMGPRNASSCEAFLLMMKQAEHAVLIGEQSMGSSGNPQPFELANGVVAYLPSWKAMDPDGNEIEGVGVAPDIEVVTSADDLGKKDIVLKAALAELRRRLAR
ncbi:MAG: S41 family peptidase [Planctomycetota bacterium]